MNMLKRLCKGQWGQSITEFALIAPLLLLLIFGIIDLGRYFYGYMQIQIAAQETVRLGGLGKTDAEIRAFAANYTGITDPAKLIVTIVPNDTTRKSGEYVTVVLQRPFDFITPLPPEVTDGIVQIKGSSTIRVE